MQNLINLLAFRLNNALTQEKCAQLLGTTKGYISQVEQGKSKLSREKVKIILDSQYNKEGFLPCYDRLLKVMDYTNNRHEISLTTINMIQEGLIGISDSLANLIISNHPEISFTWLTLGSGQMFNQNETKSSAVNNENLLINIGERLSIISEMIQEQKDKVSEIDKKVETILSLITKNCK